MKEKLKKSFNFLRMKIYHPNFLKKSKLRFVHHRPIMWMEKILNEMILQIYKQYRNGIIASRGCSYETLHTQQQGMTAQR